MINLCLSDHLGVVVEPGHRPGRLQGLDDAGEVDEAAGGVQEHLGASQQSGLWGLHCERYHPGDVGAGGHLTLVIS